LLGVEIRPAAELGDAFAQACMALRRTGRERFGWAEKSAAQGERDGLYQLGYCYRVGIGCVKDVERTKENFLVAAELGHLYGMIHVVELFDKDDQQRYIWFGRAAAIGLSSVFLNEMSDQIRNCNNGSGHANVVFFERTRQQRGPNNLWERLQV
jgi:TPR repeat protein